MKHNLRKAIRKTTFSIATATLLLTTLSLQVFAAPVVRQGSGANAAGLQATVDQFRTDLGGANNGVGGSFISGRREINWDGVPDNFSEPNNFPPNFFNVNSPRGIILNSIEDATGAALNQFAVSADTGSGVGVRFGNLNANYSTIFQTFSAQRLFIARNTHLLEVTFFIPGTKIPATVSGFGLVLADVDSATGGNRSLIRVYGPDGTQLSAASAPVQDNGLSFVGISFNAGERIARVVIESGNAALNATNNDGVGGVDVVAMDDFIYGEPRAIESHPSDYDGDGTSDFAVFRPSSGGWFILNSGSNTFNGVQFGANGDVPVDGDFDGDSRSDIAVFRPSTGQWFILRSSDGQFLATQFGQNGDKPVPADYDRDGKTDIAVWRPSVGNYFILRSSNGQFQATQFGSNGDIPVQASIVP
ncbi:MAG: VCBS repeat-containing protein [Acidobacteria bacterium]|nr:VCBS repeat-containing protein [Acidobacteriota bacterium]